MKKNTTAVSKEIICEREAQETKWGEQNHDFPTWLAILMEEVGEASKAYLHATDKAEKFYMPAIEIRKELVQVAAVAQAIIECGDRNDWWEV